MGPVLLHSARTAPLPHYFLHYLFLFSNFCDFSCYFLLTVFCICSQVPVAYFLSFSFSSLPLFLTFFVLYPGGSPSSFFFLVALRPNAGHDLLTVEVSRSHTTTQHSRQDSSGRVISPSQRPLPDNTQH